MTKHLPASASTSATAPWPHHEPDELAAAQRVLTSGKTNYWTGDEARSFEREYATFLGRQHAVALHNGTLALELALAVLGIGPGDEVITTPRTKAIIAVHLGGWPVDMPALMDLARAHGNGFARCVNDEQS